MPVPTPPPVIPGTRVSANDIIRRSLRLINVLASGEIPTSSEAQDSLVALNQMIDIWNSERLMIYSLEVQQFTLTPGKQTYTCGTGGDFNIPRPPTITYATIISLNNPAQPLELPLEMLTDAQWASIPVKNIASSLPIKFYDDGAFPFRNLSYWCVPTQAVQAKLYCWTSLTQFPDLVTKFTFPPAYLEAICFNLALRLAPEFAATPSQTVLGFAVNALGRIKSFNSPPQLLQCDEALVNPENGYYNWIADTFGRQTVGG